MPTSYYLRPDVQVEPLVAQWYACTHLIPPATAARHFVHRYLPIMDSYISAPGAHAEAVRNPDMLGGPFIDFAGQRVDEVAALRDRIIRDCEPLLELSAAIDELATLLRREARGFALGELYPRVPEALRGYVELAYDLDNHPHFRLIEPLLYASHFYDESLQSLMLSRTAGDDRPFVMSTPRLHEPGNVELLVPFASPVIDELFALKRTPRPWVEIRDRLQLRSDQESAFQALLHTEAPRPYERYRGGHARWRYFGHACILVETPSISVLTDPVLSYTYENGISRYTYEDLPDVIDYVLISHNHDDHLLFETLLQLRHRIGTIVVPRASGGDLQDPSMKHLLRRIGFQNVVELGELETIDHPTGTIVGVPFFGEHCDVDVRSKSGYMVRTGPHSLLFLADSCNLEPTLYDHVIELIGPADVLFLGMECDGAPLTWQYGELLTQPMDREMEQSRRLNGSNCDQGLAIIDRVGCREAYVYAMGQEPWLNHIMSLKYRPDSRPIVESNRLIAACRERGIVAERLFGEKEILLP